MRRVLSVTVTLLLAVTAARASPWWVSWNGDAFPETEGWSHYSSDPPAERWLEDGKLFIDSRVDWFVSDIYGQLRPGEMTPASGEVFVMRWRLKVDEVIGHTDPGVHVRSDDKYELGFTIGTDSICSYYEPDKWATFGAGSFHEFSLQSSDMRTYCLYVDSVLSLQGEFFEGVFTDPGVGWGDMSSNRSLSEWDWFQCGVVPEPGTCVCALSTLCVLGLRNRGTR